MRFQWTKYFTSNTGWTLGGLRPLSTSSVVAVGACFSRSGSGNTWSHSGHSHVAIGTSALQPGHSFIGASRLPGFRSLSCRSSTGPCRMTFPPKSRTRQSSFPGARRKPRPTIW